MARATVEVPAELVEPISETVLLLYGATAESLNLALRARAGDGEIASYRRRLAELDAVSEALKGEGRRRVSATREVLHDALYGALIDAGERLAEISNRCWRGELPLERVQEAAGEVLAIDRLLRQLDG
jgi:hypothetical protein